ncbi:MAG TPA: multicopper oxidase domain-containing protein [Anaeromyxobacteraceae bacterium]|nr:multicopper oxidase domain-containing protein [Anaeromyxobacteraceae bacterium]
MRKCPPALLTALALVACSSGAKAPASRRAAQPLDPESIRQFANPLPVIPALTPDSTSGGVDHYTVTAQQGTHDFGLRRMDGTEFRDPATGKAIVTTSWGYNGPYLGPTIEARSGRAVVVRYVNDLRGADGARLKKHLLRVDPTLHGASGGEPEIRIVPHLHGGHSAAGFDGNPEFWFGNDPAAAANGEGGPAGNAVEYTYENDQRAATLWFHDHAMGITRLNVYAGLAAFYVLRDAEEDALGLPAGAQEVALVLQDKSFNDDGSLAYDTLPLVNPYTGAAVLDADGLPVLSSKPEFFGNAITVNGVVWPFLEVEPRRYRFRLLNGSDSRFYNLWMEVTGGSGAPTVTQIGNEQGLLPASVVTGAGPGPAGLLVAPGERADLVVDFAAFAGQVVTLRNDANAPFPDGDPVDSLTTGRIMQFRVKAAASGADGSALPAAPAQQPVLAAPALTRVVDLQELVDIYQLPDSGAQVPRLELRLNGLRFDDPVTETPKLGTVEDWVIVNTTVDMHPMHLHLVAFQVLEKGSFDPDGFTRAAAGNMPVLAPGALHPDTDPEGRVKGAGDFNPLYALAPNEAGLKDTVRIPPGGYVRVRSLFDRPGRYMWHCHILSHEDHEMMRPFEVVP